jgi:Kef-type K+ transport system membrane component KefB
MPAYNAVAFLFDLLISVAIVLLIYTLLGKNLCELLDKTIRLPAGRTFYMRALAVVLLCGALTKVIGGIHQKPGDHFMEYV